MQADLRAGTGHVPTMPLLTELENRIVLWFYNDATPNGVAGSKQTLHPKTEVGLATREHKELSTAQLQPRAIQ